MDQSIESARALDSQVPRFDQKPRNGFGLGPFRFWAALANAIVWTVLLYFVGVSDAWLVPVFGVTSVTGAFGLLVLGGANVSTEQPHET